MCFRKAVLALICVGSMASSVHVGHYQGPAALGSKGLGPDHFPDVSCPQVPATVPVWNVVVWNGECTFPLKHVTEGA